MTEGPADDGLAPHGGAAGAEGLTRPHKRASRAVVQTHAEREQTFDVDDDFAVPQLAPEVDRLGARLDSPQPTSLRATYYDTEDLRLLRSGLTLRRRTGGDDEGWHLKVPTGRSGERSELRLPIDSAPAGGNIPEELAELLVGELRGAHVAPILTLQTNRVATRVLGDGGAPLLEIADDRVVAERHPDGELRTWRELEIEELAESGELARALGRALLAFGARPGTPSKVARAMRGVQRAAERDEQTKDLLARRLRALLGDIARNDLGVRRGAPDSLHDLRVAVRRTRSALRTFSALFDRERARTVRDELKWFGTVAGAARDQEVLAARARHDLDEIPREERLGPVRAELAGRLDASAAAAREKLLEAMQGERYRDLLAALDRFSAAPPYRPGASGRNATALRRCVNKEVRRTKRLVSGARRAPADRRDVAFHEARKTAKRVRYGAETLQPLHPHEAKRLAKRFAAVQELLGERHDAVVAHELLRQEGARAGVRPGENGYTYGMLAERERRAVEDADERFARVWRRAQRKSVRRFLKKRGH
ncbi:MAG: metal-binding protein [Acidimicrobiaceae bacterium]|nr:metal-binding protein [Acidimicrobiaceae bacterium]